MNLYLGIDISTTAAKALLLNENGRVVTQSSVNLSLQQPQPGWTEQEPAQWWESIQLAIRQTLTAGRRRGAEIRAIGLSGQMHGLVLLDAAGRVLRPAILWNDQRTARQCAEMTRIIGAERLLSLSGNPALTGFTAPKILWVRENEPEIYAQIAQVLLPKDYIRYCLSGDWATDLAGASGTSLLNVGARAWSEEICEALSIPLAWLPPVHEGTTITSRVSARAAEATGLRAGTPIAAGGGDQAAGAVGMGCVTPGKIGITLGTSGVVFAPLVHYDTVAIQALAGRLHTFCHAVPGLWHYMGVMLSAAGSLQWYRDAFAPNLPFDNLLAEASSIPPGSEGLFFLPHLTGERTPHPDPKARGAFVGLAAHHQRGHLTRAVLEGVAYSLRDGFSLLEESALPANLELRISGGGARSSLWQGIIAAVLGKPLFNLNTSEASAYGAALLAAVGAGEFASVPAACASWVQRGSETAVIAAEAAQYENLYPRFRALYPNLREWFAGNS